MSCDEVTDTDCFVTTRHKLMSILSVVRLLRISVSDICEVVQVFRVILLFSNF